MPKTYAVRGKALAELFPIVKAVLAGAKHGELSYPELKQILKDLIFEYPDICIPFKEQGKSPDKSWLAGFIADRIILIMVHVRRIAACGTRLRQASARLPTKDFCNNANIFARMVPYHAAG